MRILLDGPLTPKPGSGIERYFIMLVTHYPEEAKVYCSVNSHQSVSFFGRHCVVSPPLPLFKPRKLSGFLNKLFWLGKTFDVIHWMHYGPSQLAQKLIAKGVPYVVTVHDLIHEKLGAPLGLLDRSARQKSYDKAGAILCVSQNTRNDLLEEYVVDQNKVHVVHHGCSIQTVLENSESDQNRERYFLYVGPRAGYKNFSILYPQLKSVLLSYPDVRLRVVGTPLNAQEKSELNEYGLNKMIIEEGRVNDAQLSKLYSGSIALLHPSIHEGFGLPLVEAMTCGTIPIATYATCVPEVLGDAGIHIDPSLMNSGFQVAMLRLLSDPDFRRQKAKDSLLRSKDFSWESTANKTWNIYKSVSGK